jgi:hypothetical protein
MDQRKMFGLVLKYASPILLLIFLATIIVGHFFPWTPARNYIASQPGQLSVQIGFACSPIRCTSGQYIFLPAAFSSPTSVTVTQRGDAIPTVKINRYGFLLIILRIGFLAATTWWFWLRPRKEHLTTQSSGPPGLG